MNFCSAPTPQLPADPNASVCRHIAFDPAFDPGAQETARFVFSSNIREQPGMIELPL